jgi:hypothetical protein
VVIKNNKISFSNEIFNDIILKIKKTKKQRNEKRLEMLKIFKIFRKHDAEEANDNQETFVADRSEQLYSISDLLRFHQNFTHDKVFEVQVEDPKSNQKFKYVHIKI